MEFIDLKAQYRALQGEIDANIQRILAGAHFIGGEEVAEFEEKLAAYVGRRHCVTCGNGTDALQLVYMAYGSRGGGRGVLPGYDLHRVGGACVYAGRRPRVLRH